MVMYKQTYKRFQSTPSVGRATVIAAGNILPRVISIHALRGEGDLIYFFISSYPVISIHALRGEGDTVRQYII